MVRSSWMEYNTGSWFLVYVSVDVCIYCLICMSSKIHILAGEYRFHASDHDPLKLEFDCLYIGFINGIPPNNMFNHFKNGWYLYINSTCIYWCVYIISFIHLLLVKNRNLYRNRYSKNLWICYPLTNCKHGIKFSLFFW